MVWLFQTEGGRGGRLQMPYKPDLSAFLFEPSFKMLVGPALHAKMDLVRKQCGRVQTMPCPACLQCKIAPGCPLACAGGLRW